MRDYSRLDSTPFAQSRVAGVRALVVGAGALGNEVIKNLALMGVGHLDIVDRDVIEPSNLTRSVLFCTPDIDRRIEARTPKALFAAQRAREINPHVTTESHCLEVADLGASIPRRTTLAFCCVDNEMARLELGWLAARLNKPLVDGGLGLINSSSGLVSVFPGAEGPCYACRRSEERRRALLTELQGLEDPCSVKAQQQEAAGIIPTTPVMASIVGALQVEIGLRHVLADPATVDTNRGWSVRVTLHPGPSLQHFSFERSESCPLHASESIVGDVVEQPDRVSTEWTVTQLLNDLGQPDGYLQFDWPMTVRAACRTCGHRWEPMVRRARFRRSSCPACRGTDLVEIEVLSGLTRQSPWAHHTLAALGLPTGHIHEVVLGGSPEAPRRHVEVTGDRLGQRQDASTW